MGYSLPILLGISLDVFRNMSDALQVTNVIQFAVKLLGPQTIFGNTARLTRYLLKRTGSRCQHHVGYATRLECALRYAIPVNHSPACLPACLHITARVPSIPSRTHVDRSGQLMSVPSCYSQINIQVVLYKYNLSMPPFPSGNLGP